ncbi:MAG: hypothetical protein ACRC1S_06535 [Vibrio sp.]
MKYLWPVVFCTSLFFTHQFAQADDAELNRVAKKIKTQIEKSMKKSKPRSNGYCDVFIDLDYSHTKQAVVKKVTTRGDDQICQVAKKTIKIDSQYTYDWPERQLRIHISTN